MFAFPKRFLVLLTIFGFGLGLIYVLVAGHRDVVWSMLVTSTLIGTIWAGGLLLIYWWKSKPGKDGLNLAWFWLFYPVYMVASTFGYGFEAAYAIGGYSCVLLMVVQIAEWNLGRPVSWQDIKSYKRANGVGNDSENG